MMKALRNITLALVILFVLTAVPAMAGADHWGKEHFKIDVSYKSPPDGVPPEPCIGEQLLFTGTHHEHRYWVHNASGGGSLTWHVNQHGTAIGVNSGNEYQYSFNTNHGGAWIQYSDPAFHLVAIDIFKSQLIGKGKVPNLSIKCTAHGTMVRGQWTVWFYDKCHFTCH